MSNKLIRSLYESRLAGFGLLKSLPIAWENVQFTQPATAYLKSYLLKAPTGSDDLKGDHRVYEGVYQVSVFVPKGQGPQAAETLAAELATLFPLNLRLTSGSFTVQIIEPCSEGPAVQGDTHYMIPVSFKYRADTV